jgi:hypothetical protein
MCQRARAVRVDPIVAAIHLRFCNSRTGRERMDDRQPKTAYYCDAHGESDGVTYVVRSFVTD